MPNHIRMTLDFILLAEVFDDREHLMCYQIPWGLKKQKCNLLMSVAQCLLHR